jgi:hypothetical protein
VESQLSSCWFPAWLILWPWKWRLTHFSEMSVDFQWTTQHCIPEDTTLQWELQILHNQYSTHIVSPAVRLVGHSDILTFVNVDFFFKYVIHKVEKFFHGELKYNIKLIVLCSAVLNIFCTLYWQEYIQWLLSSFQFYSDWEGRTD